MSFPPLLFHLSLGCGTKVGWILRSNQVTSDPSCPLALDQQTGMSQDGADSGWWAWLPGYQGKLGPRWA